MPPSNNNYECKAFQSLAFFCWFVTIFNMTDHEGARPEGQERQSTLTFADPWDFLKPDESFKERVVTELEFGDDQETYILVLTRTGDLLSLEFKAPHGAQLPERIQDIIHSEQDKNPITIRVSTFSSVEHPALDNYLTLIFNKSMAAKESPSVALPEVLPVAGGASVERESISDWAAALQELEDIEPTLGKKKKQGRADTLLNKLKEGGLVNVSSADKGKAPQVRQAVRQELINKGIPADQADALILTIGRNIWSANEFNQPAWEFFGKAEQLLETALTVAKTPEPPKPAVPEKQPDEDIERVVREAINPVAQAIADLETKIPTLQELEKVRRDFSALVEKLADMRVLSVWQPVPSQRAEDVRKTIQGGEDKFVNWLKEKGMDDRVLGQMEYATFVLYDRPGEQRIFINPFLAKESLTDYESEQMAPIPTVEFQRIIGDLKGMAAALSRARRRFYAAQRGERAAALQEKQELLRANSERSTKLIEDLLKILQQKFDDNTLTQAELISAQGELTSFIISATHNEALYEYSQEEGIPADVRVGDAQAEAQEVLKDRGVSEEDARKLLIIRRIGGKFHIFAPAYLYESTALDNQTKAAVNVFTAQVKLAQQTLGDLSEKLRPVPARTVSPAAPTPGAGSVEEDELVREEDEDGENKTFTESEIPRTEPEGKTPEQYIRELEEEIAKLRREFEVRTQVRPAIQYQRGIEFARGQMIPELEKRDQIIVQQEKRIKELEGQLAGKVVREKNEAEQVNTEKARLFALDNRFEKAYNEEYNHFFQRTKDEKKAEALAIRVLQQMERDMNKNKK